MNHLLSMAMRLPRESRGHVMVIRDFVLRMG